MYQRPWTSWGGGVGLRVRSGVGVAALNATWLSGEHTEGANLFPAAFLRAGVLGALRGDADALPLR